jgi:hypothetical protein
MFLLGTAFSYLLIVDPTSAAEINVQLWVDG